MSSTPLMSVVYGKSVCELVRFLNGTPDAVGVRVEMGPRFWGSPMGILNGVPDSDLDDDREDLAEAIRDHPSLEVLVFSGSSLATFEDVCVLLEGCQDHDTVRSIMIPVVPPEWYRNPLGKSAQIQRMIRLATKTKTLTNLYLTNGTNRFEDSQREPMDTDITIRVRKTVNRMLCTRARHSRI